MRTHAGLFLGQRRARLSIAAPQQRRLTAGARKALKNGIGAKSRLSRQIACAFPFSELQPLRVGLTSDPAPAVETVLTRGCLPCQCQPPSSPHTGLSPADRSLSDLVSSLRREFSYFITSLTLPDQPGKSAGAAATAKYHIDQPWDIARYGSRAGAVQDGRPRPPASRSSAISSRQLSAVVSANHHQSTTLPTRATHSFTQALLKTTT